MNDLIIYGLELRQTNRDVLTNDLWEGLVEADYAVNAVQVTLINPTGATS